MKTKLLFIICTLFMSFNAHAKCAKCSSSPGSTTCPTNCKICADGGCYMCCDAGNEPLPRSCDPGYYLLGSSCEPCAKGTYKSTNDIFLCETCPKSSNNITGTTASTASTKQSDCYIPSGQTSWSDVTGTYTCGTNAYYK